MTDIETMGDRLAALQEQLEQVRTRAEAAEAELHEAREERRKWETAAREFCSAHVGQRQAMCPACEVLALRRLVPPYRIAALQAWDDLCRLSCAGSSVRISYSVDPNAVEHVAVECFGERRVRQVGRGPTAQEDALAALLREWRAERSASGRALVGEILGDRAAAEAPRA